MRRAAAHESIGTLPSPKILIADTQYPLTVNYPPLVLTQAVTTATVLAPQAPRDTDTPFTEHSC